MFTTQRITEDEINIEMYYTAGQRATITANDLPEGYTLQDIKEIRDGKWTNILITFHDDTELEVETHDTEGEDFKWTYQPIRIFNDDWDELTDNYDEIIVNT